MTVGTTVYLNWYDFTRKTEHVCMGMVVDNSLWDGTQWHDYINVSFQPPHSAAPFCHHFMPDKLAMTPGNVPHDDCYLACAKHKDNTDQEFPSHYELLVQQFKEDHWDHKHNHLKTSCLETFYDFWRKAHGGSRDYVTEGLKKEQSSYRKKQTRLWPPSDDITAHSQRDYGSLPTTRNAVQQPVRTQQTKKRKSKPTNSIQLSLFD